MEGIPKIGGVSSDLRIPPLFMFSDSVPYLPFEEVVRQILAHA